MTTKPQEFSGSLEHAEVMFDALAGVEGRYLVRYFMPRDGLRVCLMLPTSRRSAFSNGQTFHSVGIHDGGVIRWFWAEELFVCGPKVMSDLYGQYLHYDFYSRGPVWCGADPERLEPATTLAA